MISLAEVAPHTASTAHSHPEEQWGYLLEGECIRIQNDEEVSMKKGDLWHTPPNTLHSVKTGEVTALIMDIFSPPRPAYTKPGEGFAATMYSENRILRTEKTPVNNASILRPTSWRDNRGGDDES